jgi:hypothetical protein
MIADLTLLKKVVKDVEDGHTSFNEIYRVIREMEKKQIDMNTSSD